MTGGPGKQQGTNTPPPTRRVWERSKGDTTCPPTFQNHLWHPSWLNKACTTRKSSESEWLSKDNPDTNPITIRPETAGHETELFSWVPLPSRSPPGCPFPIKISCFLSTCVSSDNSFPSVRQEPSFGPWKGSPFLQQSHLSPGYTEASLRPPPCYTVWAPCRWASGLTSLKPLARRANTFREGRPWGVGEKRLEWGDFGISVSNSSQGRENRGL